MIDGAKQLVMPGPDPGIHVFAMRNLDGRDEPGHDDDVNHLSSER